MYIKMVEEMADDKFDMDSSAKVLSMMVQTISDLECRILELSKEFGVGRQDHMRNATNELINPAMGADMLHILCHDLPGCSHYLWHIGQTGSTC